MPRKVRCAVRGTAHLLIYDGRNFFWCETVRLSCSSDFYDSSKRYAGLVLYGKGGSSKFELNGHRVRCGYVIIKDSSELGFSSFLDGVVHGDTFHSVFGLDELPEDLVAEGFSITGGEVVGRSGTFNTGGDMQRASLDLVEELASGWRRGSVQPGTTATVKDLMHLL
ncbi:hypothetical protein HYH03_005784 [Edaphochlamys debaryana]|uniref:Uncharacterized protein n=1 Tax=Edaphochlamys debaryana TaxID=47281 RepID=A0A835Y6S4_9CHLO|nr:hypothetical protein HYH03_005784 [Edaphochlamys debaryana]|eukprot:KAG2496184.1 hypothetical protein HYH03_005784 [Edaphochlamys debaryana]